MKNYWLFKTEPGEYSWEDLQQDMKTVWDGVKAGSALKNLSLVKPDDLVFIYHTGKEKAIVGIAKVVSKPYPNPDEEDKKLLVADIVPLKSMRRPVTLKQIKESNHFPDWDLVRLPRLSVVPVNQEQWNMVTEWDEV